MNLHKNISDYNQNGVNIDLRPVPRLPLFRHSFYRLLDSGVPAYSHGQAVDYPDLPFSRWSYEKGGNSPRFVTSGLRTLRFQTYRGK